MLWLCSPKSLRSDVVCAPDSQYFYALLKYYGEGTPQDRNMAARYFRKAAVQGHKEGATNLGVMYYSASGTSPVLAAQARRCALVTMVFVARRSAAR